MVPIYSPVEHVILVVSILRIWTVVGNTAQLLLIAPGSSGPSAHSRVVGNPEAIGAAAWGAHNLWIARDSGGAVTAFANAGRHTAHFGMRTQSQSNRR